MSITNKYKKLSEVEHVLARPGRYVGSINKEKKNSWYIENGEIKFKDVVITPAFHKLFDEIISNSADHARTPEGASLTNIDVTVEGNKISVYDNGGIPVEIHPEYQQYIPDMIFGELRSGSNFDDAEDSLSTGQNGEGSSLVNIFSTSFLVETALNGKSFKIEYTDNLSNKTEPKIGKSAKSFTRITYVTDLPRLNMTEISPDDILMIERRVYEIAFTNPKLKVSFNGKKIEINTFEKFVKQFSNESVYYECGDRWRLGIAYSAKSFDHVSFVNSTPSFDGGTHLDYVTDKIIDAIREKIEKKTKQTIKPSDIKNNLVILLDCNINNPRYNSQTKEKLITPPSQFGSQFTLDEKFIAKLLKSKVVENIIEWAMRKKEMDELKKIEDHAKKARSKGFHDIPKYRTATSKKRDECSLFLCEGDSAMTPLEASSNPKIHGLFPLRGKPENCFAKSLSDVVSQEFMHISRILNLSITNPKYEDMRYKEIIIATDADYDGYHITMLLTLLFKKFWSRLLEEGRVKIIQTPTVIVTYKGKKYNFIKEEDYNKWIVGKTGYTTKYCKGLGGHDSKTFKSFIDDPNSYVTIGYEPERDDESLAMAFDPKRADDRKEWVAIV